MSASAFEPARWRDWPLPILLGFVVGVALAPFVLGLIAFLAGVFQ